MNQSNKEQLVLAALFHDVGKAIMRLKNCRESHSYVGAKFLQERKCSFFNDNVIKAVFDHHDRYQPSDEEIKFYETLSKQEDSQQLVQILKKADSFDAGQRRAEGEKADEKHEQSLQQQIQETRLLSFFSYANKKISDKKENINFKELDVFPLQFFSGPAFGVNERHYSYSKMLSYLSRDYFERVLVLAVENKSFEHAVNNSLVWLREFSWFMPASTHWGENKSSLFEHSKNVAALAQALVEGDQKKPVLLAVGDFTGIQDFIKTQSFKSEGQKGFTKRSRGRSFLVNILTELCIQLLLKRTGLTRTGIVLSAGGRFYLLVPNSEKNRNALDKTALDINKFLFRYTEKLGFSLAFVEVEKEDFEPKNLHNLLKSLNEEKLVKSKFERLFSEEMIETVFEREFGERQCGSCGFKGEGSYSNSRGLCKMCSLAEVIGSNYSAKKLYIVSSKVAPKNSIRLDLFDHRPFNELGKISLIAENENELLFPKQFTDGFFYCFVDYGHLLEKYTPGSCFFSFKLIEAIKNKNVSFDFGFKPSTGTPELEEISKVKHTTARLAHFMIDVDGLGKILKEAETISQLSTISAQLLAFFGKKISEIWNENSKLSENFYTVFIGGDDLYLIGRYDRMFLHSKELIEEFSKFYGGQITASGGFTILSHGFPMTVAMGLTQEELSKAKSYVFDGKEKNAVSLFGKTLSWNDWFKVLDFAEKLRQSKVSTGQIYNLMELIEKNKKNRSRKIPLAHYFFGRMREGKKEDKELILIDNFEKEVLSTTLRDSDDNHTKKVLLIMKIALLLRRIDIANGGD